MVDGRVTEPLAPTLKPSTSNFILIDALFGHSFLLFDIVRVVLVL